MKKMVILLALGASLFGCAANSCYNFDGYAYYTYEIEIISDPPGAKIEWNNEYKGETPLKLTLDGSYNNVHLIAYPAGPGQYTQEKYLSNANQIPRKIYFNMYLRPVSKEYDINIRQR